ncbi:unnamed protein product [Ectocarpus sp. 12 AP-2014]
MNAGSKEQQGEALRAAGAAGRDNSTGDVPGDAQGGDAIDEGGGSSSLAERGSGSAEHSGSVEKGAAPSSPTKEKWVYSADALRRDLENIPTQKDIPQLVSAVKDVCEEHGVKMAVSTSTKEKGGGRLVSTTLLCVHGMPLRKKTASSDNNTKSRKSDSQSRLRLQDQHSMAEKYRRLQAPTVDNDGVGAPARRRQRGCGCSTSTEGTIDYPNEGHFSEAH